MLIVFILINVWGISTIKVGSGCTGCVGIIPKLRTGSLLNHNSLSD